MDPGNRATPLSDIWIGKNRNDDQFVILAGPVAMLPGRVAFPIDNKMNRPPCYRSKRLQLWKPFRSAPLEGMERANGHSQARGRRWFSG